VRRPLGKERPRFGQRHPVLAYFATLTAIAAFALFPLICALISLSIADAAGCRVDEAGSYPCIIFGTDIGESLGFLFVFGWLGMATIPLGLACFLFWTGFLIARIIRKRRRQPQQ
jgi:threonine/homoserine efflux transporter RhtA